MVKISVIMSVYNSQTYLGESIESILSQTYKDLEFIIIDDGSIDDSPAIIADYRAKDSRIRLVRNKKNLGLTKSLIHGVSIAKGRYIARQDADDISLPSRLDAQLSFMECNPDIYLLGTNAYFLYKDKFFTKWTVIGSENNARKLPSYNYIVHSSIMFRNLGKANYREKFITTQDYDLYLNILSQGLAIDNLPMPLVCFRICTDSISSKKRAMQKLFGRAAKRFYWQRMNNGKDEYSSFDPAKEHMEKGSRVGQDYAAGVQFLIDLLIYSDKKETLRLLLENRSKLPLFYILRKAALLLMPGNLQRYQVELRKGAL